MKTKPNRDYSRTGKELIIEALATQNLSIRDGAGIADREYQVAQRIFRGLHAQKFIHIASYRINPDGPHEAVYALGEGRDARNPPPMSSAEKHRRQKRKRNGITTDPILNIFYGVRK